MAKDIYKLHVVERGKGRPVILLHGGLSTHRYWNDVAALLEDKRHLLLPDLLGFGSSPKPREAEYSLGQFIACLDHTFEAYDFKEPPVLAGHSMGALIALRWAANQPERFAGVVLSSPLFFEESRFYQQMASIALEGRWLTNKFLAKTITKVMGLTGLVPTPLARLVRSRPRHVMEDVTRQRFYVYRKVLRNNYFGKEVIEDLKNLKPPVRILVGERDPMANHVIEELENLCKINKRCNMMTMPGAHQLPLEHPEVIADAISSV